MAKEITEKRFDDDEKDLQKDKSPTNRRKTADIKVLEEQYHKDLKLAKQNSLNDKHYIESEVRFRKEVNGGLNRR